MRTTLLLSLALALSGWAAASQPADPDAEAARLQALPARYQEMVNGGEISGAVLLVAHHGRTVLLQAVGFQDIEARKKMRTDSIFQMMSMTKPVTAAGIMMLVDEGKLALVDPVARYLPEARDLMVAAPEGPHRPPRAVTIRDLLTHTSGMGAPPREFRDLHTRASATLAEAVSLFLKQPLRFDPGTKFAYSNTGIATAGRIIEVVSGKAYEQFLEERLFTPLGMKDSVFFPDEARQARVAVYYNLQDGQLRPRSRVRSPGRYPAPESGLYSTAEDMAAFHQMMLNGGTWNARRILSRSAVEVMTEVHTGNLETKDPGFGWGLGWHVVRDPLATLGLLSPGTFGHGGAWNTYGFVDPSKDLVGVIMMQHEGPNEQHVREIFTGMVNAAIDHDRR